MDYDIYKDDSVTSTVDRIINILSSVGIKLEECIVDVPTDQNRLEGYTEFPTDCKYLPFSSRVSLFGIDSLGANGKGTTKENCRASAYSEFIERLQNQRLSDEKVFLMSDAFYFAPDEQDYSEDTEQFISKYNYAEIIHYCMPKKINKKPIKKVSIPYFNVKDNKVHYLPLLRYILTANGMSAGNTPEEALVQGFSEICERYAHREVFTKKIPMPEIPKKYYEKYERIKGLIDYSEQLGWKVSIKDASLGKGLPVICTIFENQNLGYFSYKFGSQPSLPIAIERTLTEFFQGGVIKVEDLKFLTFNIEDYSTIGLKNVFTAANGHRWFFELNGKMYNIFYKKNPNYKFSLSSWVDDNKKYTNKELLKFIVDKITNVTDNDIYVRDVSFLGFPAYHIFIPKFSETIYFDKQKFILFRWHEYEKDSDDPVYNIDNLISSILFRQNYSTQFRTLALSIPDEYLMVLCYILKNDIENILKYCEKLKKIKEPQLAAKFVSENLNLINLIYQYYKLKQQKEPKNVIKNIINNIYDKKILEEFYNLINNLDFEYIKNIISKSNEKYYKQEESIEDISLKNRIHNVEQKMIQKYIQNTPDQNKLAEVFDFSDISIKKDD